MTVQAHHEPALEGPTLPAHTIRPMRRTHRDHNHLTDCTLGARCKRRHSFYVECACGWYDWRGRRNYVEREIQTHLQGPEAGPAETSGS